MKPELVVMAAGMGSRYGGLKQIDPIGPNGEIIIDYSLYDARCAGFESVCFVIKHEIEKDFKKIIENGAGKYMNVSYVYQDINDIPEGFSVPVGRVKPWGTGHAVLAAKEAVKAPFAVLNSDDYYGPGSFKLLYDYLSKAQDKEKYDFCMIGYKVENTITLNGSVARGICRADEDGCLSEIIERTKIQLNGDKIQFSEDDAVWHDIPFGSIVSMNMFGFTPVIFDELKRIFKADFPKIVENNPLKGEFFIPKVVDDLIKNNLAKVKIIPSEERWYGVTYKEDKKDIVRAMQEKIKAGVYPEKLWV